MLFCCTSRIISVWMYTAEFVHFTAAHLYPATSLLSFCHGIWEPLTNTSMDLDCPATEPRPTSLVTHIYTRVHTHTHTHLPALIASIMARRSLLPALLRHLFYIHTQLPQHTPLCVSHKQPHRSTILISFAQIKSHMNVCAPTHRPQTEAYTQ